MGPAGLPVRAQRGRWSVQKALQLLLLVLERTTGAPEVRASSEAQHEAPKAVGVTAESPVHTRVIF